MGVCVYVHVCRHACVRVFVHACERACVQKCVGVVMREIECAGRRAAAHTQPVGATEAPYCAYHSNLPDGITLVAAFQRLARRFDRWHVPRHQHVQRIRCVLGVQALYPFRLQTLQGPTKHADLQQAFT